MNSSSQCYWKLKIKYSNKKKQHLLNYWIHNIFLRFFFLQNCRTKYSFLSGACVGFGVIDYHGLILHNIQQETFNKENKFLKYPGIHLIQISLLSRPLHLLHQHHGCIEHCCIWSRLLQDFQQAVHQWILQCWPTADSYTHQLRPSILYTPYPTSISP